MKTPKQCAPKRCKCGQEFTPTSSAPTIELSFMEHEIILLMREYMSQARQRALLAELKEEAGKFG